MRKQLAAIAITVLTSSVAHAEPNSCDAFALSGQTSQLDPAGPFNGQLELTNLVSGQTLTVKVSTLLLGQLNASAITSHDVGGSDGDIHFTTFDKAYLNPTGVPGEFALTSHLKITSGLGRYNCGEIVIDGDSTIRFDQGGLGSSQFAGLGKLCRCR